MAIHSAYQALREANWRNVDPGPRYVKSWRIKVLLDAEVPRGTIADIVGCDRAYISKVFQQAPMIGPRKIGERREHKTVEVRWTPARLTELKALWIEGASARQIALRISDTSITFTRSAVLGQVRRSGLPQRKTRESVARALGQLPRGSEQARLRRKRLEAELSRTGTPEFSVVPIEVTNDELVTPPEERKSFEALGDKDCRWPFSDVGKHDFGFCNLRQIPGSSYCARHHARATGQPQVGRPVVPVENEKVPA